LGIKVGVISDLHTDANKPFKVTDNLIKICREKEIDTIICAGDISSCYDTTLGVIGKLDKNGIKCLFVQGNHELWKTKKYPDSLVLYNKYREHEYCLSDKIVVIGDYVIVGDVGWYDFSFRDFMKYTLTVTKQKHGWGDKHGVTFDDVEFCRYQNDKFLSMIWKAKREHPDKKIIVVSHMLPFIEHTRLYPDTYFDSFVGNVELGNILRQENVCMSIFGHNHLTMDGMIDGIKYVNSPLGYQMLGEWGSLGIEDRLRQQLRVIEL